LAAVTAAIAGCDILKLLRTSNELLGSPISSLAVQRAGNIPKHHVITCHLLLQVVIF
jgi:hypothetical protein